MSHSATVIRIKGMVMPNKSLLIRERKKVLSEAEAVNLLYGLLHCSPILTFQL